MQHTRDNDKPAVPPVIHTDLDVFAYEVLDSVDFLSDQGFSGPDTALRILGRLEFDQGVVVSGNSYDFVASFRAGRHMPHVYRCSGYFGTPCTDVPAALNYNLEIIARRVLKLNQTSKQMRLEEKIETNCLVLKEAEVGALLGHAKFEEIQAAVEAA